MKLTVVARDKNGKIMWIKGRTDLSPLTFREWKEGEDMQTGHIQKIETGEIFLPPFTVGVEEI